MHPKLIKANIALFNGARAEARRLLSEYRAEAVEAKPTPMIVWMEAQAQDKHEERVERLYTLVEETGENNRYARQAKAYIEDECAFNDKGVPGTRSARSASLAGVPLGKAALFAIIGGMISFIVFSVLNPGVPTTSTVPTQQAGVVTSGDATLGIVAETPLNLPDQSTPITNPDQFRASYTQGSLEITAIEDNSQRAADISELVVLNPTTGARFYAIKLVFECRVEICEDPPEAILELELDGGNVREQMSDVGIHGEPVFQRIADGLSTQGWAVFEIAESSTPVRLIITPETSGATETPQPIFIDLPAS